MMKYLNSIEKKLNDWGVIYKGCPNNQIIAIEKKINKKLPACYVEFLERMGYDMDRKDMSSKGGFVGESIFYTDVFNEDYTNKDGLIEQLKDDDRTDLLEQINENVFVFFSSQGYIYAFFKLDEGDNPPIYGYIEGYEKESFPKLTNSLLEFFEKYLESGQSPFAALK